MMPMRRVCAAVAAAVVGGMLTVVPVGTAFAHTELEAADPAPESEVDDVQDITLTFSGALAEDGDHEIGLFDGDARLGTGSTEMLDERTIAADVLGPVPAAELTVRWVIVAGDGDEQRGDYSVTLTEPVQESVPVPEEPAVSTSPLPTGPPSTAAADATSDGVSELPAGRVNPTGPGDDESGPASPVALAVAGVGAVAIAGAAVVAVRRRG